MFVRRLFHLAFVLVLAAGVITSGGAWAQPDPGISTQSVAVEQSGAIGPWQIAEVVPQGDTPDGNAPDRGVWPVERAPYAPDDQDLQSETEPNDTAATATTLTGSNTVVLGNI